jgi:hypothetical protein
VDFKIQLFNPDSNFVTLDTGAIYKSSRTPPLEKEERDNASDANSTASTSSTSEPQRGLKRARSTSSLDLKSRSSFTELEEDESSEFQEPHKKKRQRRASQVFPKVKRASSAPKRLRVPARPPPEGKIALPEVDSNERNVETIAPLLEDPLQFTPIAANDWKTKAWDYGFESSWSAVQNPLLYSSTSSECSEPAVPMQVDTAEALTEVADLDSLLQITTFDTDPFAY